MPSLSAQDNEKYKRHLLIDGFTSEHQEKICQARVLVIGCGGLGTPVLLYLAGAGVGTLGIVEFDQVDISNLHRQIAYTNDDIGKNKIDLLTQKLSELNPTCKLLAYPEKWIEKESACSIARNYDMIIDCTDTFDSRYLSDQVSQKLNIPFVYGAIYQMEGQAAVFNYRGSKTYRDVFPKSDKETAKQEGGVIGPIAGVIGSIQATEALKIITGIGDVLVNKMLIVSLKSNIYKVVGY